MRSRGGLQSGPHHRPRNVDDRRRRPDARDRRGLPLDRAARSVALARAREAQGPRAARAQERRGRRAVGDRGRPGDGRGRLRLDPARRQQDDGADRVRHLRGGAPGRDRGGAAARLHGRARPHDADRLSEHPRLRGQPRDEREGRRAPRVLLHRLQRRVRRHAGRERRASVPAGDAADLGRRRRP